MNLVYSLQLILTLTTSAIASFEYHGKTMELSACRYELDLKNITFCEHGDKTCSYCTNENILATLAGCLAYKNRNTTYTIEGHVRYCKKHYKTELDPNWYEISLEKFNKYARNQSEIEPSEKPIDYPIRFSTQNMDLYSNSACNFLGNYDDSVWYGVGVFAFWLVVLLISMVSHWTMVLFPGTAKKWVGPIANFYRKHVSTPALYGKRKAQAMPGWIVFHGLVPTRFESIVIALFYLFILIIHTIKIQALENDPIYGKYIAELRYVAVRTGIVGTIMLPLVILFAGRNNFLQWLCGIKCSTFFCYHRHIARVMFMLVVIHSVNFTIVYVYRDKYIESFKISWWSWGVVATAVGGIMLVQSILYLRRNWYHLFLPFHIVLAVIFIVGTWIHVKSYEILLYPVIAVWVFDRVVRLCRIFYFGFPKVNISLVGDETIKLIIPKPKHLKVIPGGYAFLHFLKPCHFWQSHPFTFANSMKDGKENIVMYFKVKGGVTRSLYKLLNKSPGKTTTMRIAVEGPYGEPTPARYSDKAVFIAGGNGIPGIYSEIYDIALRSSPERKSVLKLIWVIREYKSLVWFHDELLKLKDTNIDTTIYVTRPNIKLSKIEELKNSDSSKEGSIDLTKSRTFESEDIIGQLKQELSHIHFEEGRPNLEELIEDEIKESPGSISFVTCGNPVMVDEIRYHTCKNIDNPYKKRVDFYEQLQVWA